MSSPFSGADILANQRKSPRAVFHRRGQLHDEKNGVVVPVKTLDISESGVGLISPHPFQIQQVFALTIPTHCHGFTNNMHLKGKIAYCILAGTQGYRIGVEYTEILPQNKQIIKKIVSAGFPF